MKTGRGFEVGKVAPRLTVRSRAESNSAVQQSATPRYGFGTSRWASRKDSAFTLIEVVISSALMAMIIVSAYLCFSAGIATRKTMEPRLEVIQNARVAFALITADLRGACPLDKDNQFIGMHRTLGDMTADNLDFGTHNYTPRHPREGDFCQMSYYVNQDPETGKFSLWRRRNPVLSPDPLSGGSKEQIAEHIRGVQFEYSDGLDWYDTWGDASGRGKAQTSQRTQPNLSGMPNAVRVTIWFDSEASKKPANPDEPPPPSLMFQTVVQLAVASSSSGADSTSGTSGGSGDASMPGGAPGPGGVN